MMSTKTLSTGQKLSTGRCR